MDLLKGPRPEEGPKWGLLTQPTSASAHLLDI